MTDQSAPASKEQIEEKVSRRNAESIKVRLEQQDQLFREQMIKINLLNDALSTMQHRLNILEQRINLEKIKTLGTGPSVRE